MMGVDRLSPIAPVRVKVLLLPVGKIRRSRFLSFVARLQAENVVRLGDVSPDPRPNRSMPVTLSALDTEEDVIAFTRTADRASIDTFSPLAFPSGMILYDLSYSIPPTSHLEVFPFEVFREPLVVLALADGAELSQPLEEDTSDAVSTAAVSSRLKDTPELDELLRALAVTKDRNPRALVHQLLVFDYRGVEKLENGPDDVLWIPRPEVSKATTIKTAICDITSLLLGELDEFAKMLQTVPSIESPKTSSWGPHRGPEIRPRPVDRLMHRMTMPAQLTPRPSGSSEALPTSTRSSPAPMDHDSPTTFDEISRSISLSNRRGSTAKASSIPASKEHSRDRMSVTGLSASDRTKSRVKGRLGVVVGTLYLQAGRWPDALKELVEAAVQARASSDYIWHGKALESILLCLLMVGWAGMDFQIPPICYPVAEKSSKAFASFDPTPIHSPASAVNRAGALQNLATLLPDLANNIIHLYIRAVHITEEPLPPLILSETVIRLTRLLVAVRTRDGVLDDNALKHVVMNEPLVPQRLAERPKAALAPRKSDITSFLFRALPLSATTDLPATDTIPILIGVVSVLSHLDLSRKQALILRELLSVMVPTLVQARKIGAAEVGIHPAAGLSSLNDSTFEINALDMATGNMEKSIRALLTKLGDIYGVQLFSFDEWEARRSSGSSTGEPNAQVGYDSVEAIVERAFRHVALDAYGDMHLKVDVLKTCINCCEALPDFRGVLQFTVGLLQTIRRDLMVAEAYRSALYLPPDEQIRLLNNIRRTVDAAQKLGAPALEAEYWDDFLVRGIDLLPSIDAKRLTRRSTTDFDAAINKTDASGQDPLLYNPFSKPTTKTSELLLVAGEAAVLKVTLQNPYEFELEIERLEFETSGVELQGAAEHVLLPPLSLHEVLVPIVAAGAGTLTIAGCHVKVRNCRRRKFPIFADFWKPEPETKLKRTGLNAKKPISDRPPSWCMATSQDGKTSEKGPKTTTREFRVVSPQPSLVIESMSLSQSAMMVLEGETRTFDITVRNVSSCPLDFVMLTFHDSMTRQLQSALTNKNLLPVEIYELELKLSTAHALRWQRNKDEHDNISIPAGGTAKFTIEVLGKPGLQDATVQIDYSRMDAIDGVRSDVFYTRQLLVPLTITVNASVEVARCDVLPLSGDFAWRNRLDLDVDTGAASASAVRKLSSSQDAPFEVSSILSRLGKGVYGPDHCILVLEVRNSWPSSLSVAINALENPVKSSAQPDNADSQYTVSQDLPPGQHSRFLLVLPRVHLHNPHAPIPTLNTGSRRQFVVSANKLTFEAEAASREAFWFREEILKRISGTWTETSTGRSGTVDLRNIRLNARMVDAVRLEDIDVAFSVTPAAADSDRNPPQASVKQFGRAKFAVKTDELFNLIVTVSNRSLTPIQTLLRLQPSVRNQPNNIALDLSRRLVWTGMLQQVLPVIPGGGSAQATIGVAVLCRGEFEFGASVEEVRLSKPSLSASSSAAEAETPQIDHHDGPIADTFAADVVRRRRIWHATETCILNAHD